MAKKKKKIEQTHPYAFDPKYKKSVAYFSMEFAIDQPLKIYSGGLGFLSGSHMRSAHDLKQNVIGIGILWRNGYYDQVRKGDQTMDALFQEKYYSYLVDIDVKFSIDINNHPVQVKVFYLPPEIFGTVPMYFLSTAIPENDYLAQATSYNLYDANSSGKVAQSILLGQGGAKLIDILGLDIEVYHLNEAHALSAAFYLYNKFKDVEEVRKRMVFTTHTPEEAGNEKHDIHMLKKMNFFNKVPLKEVREMTGIKDDTFNHTLAALRLSRKANGVSKLHGEVSRQMWGGYEDIPEIISITNSQNSKYWQDNNMYDAVNNDNDSKLNKRKRYAKRKLFEVVADQTGNLFDEKVLTMVWARRFAAYKRPDLITWDQDRFEKLITDSKQPIQIIWAGKPYPMDYGAIQIFNTLVHLSKKYKNIAVLTGYELQLSKLLKGGSDVWLNTPRVTREASGTSGMAAAMNGSINFSTYDGWIPEFARHDVNSFVSPEVDVKLPIHEQDILDTNNVLDMLENDIIPTYYEDKDKWTSIMKNSMKDVVPYFDADRMAYEYYDKLY